MGSVVRYKPNKSNKLYRFIGTTALYIEEGKQEAARDYLKSLPLQIRDQIIITLIRTGYMNGSDFPA